MASKRPPGLFKRKGVWHIDKQIGGERICESCGTSDLDEAQQYLARVIEEKRKARIYGVRPSRSFEQAATKFIIENQHKKSIRNDIGRLKNLMPWVGDVPVEKMHRGLLDAWVAARVRDNISAGTINHGIKVVRRIMNLAASEWIDENGLTWIASTPKFKLLDDRRKKQPYPLSWDEEVRLFAQLPDHLRAMAMFAVNTGCRDGEICSLKWKWEIPIPSLNTSVFLIPGEMVKNGDDRLVVLNRFAEEVVDSQRGIHTENVFSFKGKSVTRMLNTAWLKARERAQLHQVRVHDLKHTFGRRLRASGVSFEDRQDLLGHRSGRITTHYSAAELSNLITAANTVCAEGENKPEIVIVRRFGLS